MADEPHIMIIESRFHEDVADALSAGAIAHLDTAGVTHERFAVPGALEIPAIIKYNIRGKQFASARRRFDGYVALGCVIRGETGHYDHVCRETIGGLQDLVLEFSLALGMGVLTVDTHEQAMARAAADQGNKGGAAAATCLAMLEHKRHFNLYPR